MFDALQTEPGNTGFDDNDCPTLTVPPVYPDDGDQSTPEDARTDALRKLGDQLRCRTVKQHALKAIAIRLLAGHFQEMTIPEVALKYGFKKQTLYAAAKRVAKTLGLRLPSQWTVTDDQREKMTSARLDQWKKHPPKKKRLPTTTKGAESKIELTLASSSENAGMVNGGKGGAL
jgi:hypothetical protein